MEDERGRTSQGQGIADQFKVVGIDAALLLEEKPLGRVRRVVETLGKDRRYLILTLEGNGIEEDAAKAFVRELSLNATEIRKLPRRIDEAPVLIGSVLGRKGGWTLADKIEAGKKILHLAKRRSPFVSVFNPPLLNLARKRYPEAGQVLSRLPPWQGMEKDPTGNPSDRIEVYRKILSMIDEYRGGDSPLLMVCKEDPAVVRALKFKYARCNCLA